MTASMPAGPALDAPARRDRHDRHDRGHDGDLPEIRMVHPMPGFGGLRRFVLVTLAAGPDDESPMYELRSLERADVRFMVAVPGAFFSGYDIELGDQECGDLDLRDPDDALVLVVLTVGPDAASTTANLLAPLVINSKTRDAAQVILTGSDWPVRAPLG